MAERAAREERLAQERSNAAAAVEQSKDRVRAKAIRQKRVLGALLGAFVLFSAVNLLGFGVLSAPRPESWTAESLDRYLREELQFHAAGRLPPELEPYLGGRLNFGWRSGYRYDWQNWMRDDGPTGNAVNLGVLRGLTVRSDVKNHPILLAIARHYDGELVVRRRHVTFIMEPYKKP